MKFLIVILFHSFIFGLSAQKVSSVFDGDYDFSEPKTYDWSKSTKMRMKQFINVPYGSKEIMSYLKEYGYGLEERNPDLIVDIDFDQSKSMGIEKNNTVARTGPRTRRNRTGAINVSAPAAVKKNEGTFTLKLINPESNDAVWFATATDEIDEDMDIEKRQKRVRKTVKKMFKKFPGKG